jgi:peptidoglycan-N-acetylglucosamine deacetylase
MAPRWSWDFEDEPQPKPRGRPLTPRPADADGGASPTPAPGAPGAPRREVLVRRRRALALLAALVLLVLIVALASGGSHHAANAGSSKALAHAASKPPTDPQKDELQAVQSVLAYTPFIKEGTANAREIALTFDDGPGPFTPQVLSVLEHYHVRATFFVIGRMLRYFGNSTVREIEDGDVIGDHTENHPMLAHLSAHEQYEELFEQIVRVELLGGHRPVLFRPPYGSFNAITFRELQRLHLLMVLWSVDTDDYEQPGVPVIVQRATEGMHPGAIILMHDAGGQRQQTIEALPLVIKAARARGYKLVTVPELLASDPPPHGQPIPQSLAGD